MTETEDETAALARVKSAHENYRTVRAHAAEEAMRLVDRQVGDARAELREEIEAAEAAGISRRRIAQEGLGTKDYRTLQKIIRETRA